MSLGRAIARLAEVHPSQLAVIDAGADPASYGATLTWQQLDRRSNAMARVLRERGVGQDDVVSFVLPSGAELVTLCAAIWKAGATPQPLPPDLSLDDVTTITRLAGSALVVGDTPANAAVPYAELDRAVRAGADDGPLPDRWAGSWKAPVSSGSTGVPKVIFSAAPARIDPERPTAPYIPRSAVQLVPAPLHHAAQFLFAMRGLTLGHTLVTMVRFDPEACLRLIAEHRVTWAVLSPAAMLRIWRAAGRAHADVSSVASVLHVGAPCAQWLKRAWIDWLGAERVDEIYSGTESIGVTYISGPQWLTRPGSVGRPVQGTTLQVVDERGAPVPAGTVGRVVLRPRGGPGSTYRYAGRTTASRTPDGMEGLGDLGWLDEDGWLFLADRDIDVIDTANGPVYPSIVEAVLDASPQVRSSAVVGRPGDAGHELVHAVVEANDGVEGNELVRWCRSRLPADLVPHTVEVVANPLRDDFGKVRRAELRPAQLSSDR